jgi:adhesin HecA-like repeat protein
MNSGSKIVRAFFAATWTVTSPADSGAGSLRQNLADALDGDTIVLPAGQTITLATPLDPVNKSFVIKGNGATLTQSGFTASTTSQLLRISGASTTVSISRLHFKGGRVTNNGGAISNAGKLTLESCIFSDNQATLAGAGYGGAVYTAGTNSALTVTGCTFYGNKATGTSSRGGAVYKNSGALTLAGNIFWDNTASSYPVVYGSSVASDGFNVSDKPGGATASGWTFATGAAPDTQASSLPVSPVSFKPLSGSEAAGVVTALPGGYPDLDFYGQTITAPAAAGAVQGAAAAGFVLTYSAVGPGTVALTNGAADSDGLTSDASVTLRATPVGSGASFIRWLVNGATHPETSAVLNLTMDGHKTVKAVFATVWTVTSPANSGAGSLYQALTDASDGELISISLPPGQTTITLTTALPQITKSLTIEGNGATLTQSGFTASATSQLLYISSATAVVSISRLHFTGGRGINAGAAIYNAGILTLESCIFSGNQTTMNGGAVYTTGAASALTIAGCTFYGNAAGASSGWGGAVYKASGALTLTGNLFWGNTASGYPVVYGSPVVSGGFNVSDKPGGTGSTASNWTFVTGDKQVTALPLVPGSFKPFGGSDGAAGVLTARPANYPSTDFYGISISDNNAAAGAVQTTVTGFKLEYSPVGLGTVALTSGTVDSDGLTSDTSVTLTATAAGSGTNFARWVVNETTHPETSAVLNLTMDGHKTVKAVFVTVWPVTSPADSGAGSLRQALTEASDGDTIVLAGQTITLETPLDPVNKSLAILGNGATLTQTGFTASTASQLLYIGSATADVSVSRLHFKGGRVTNPGGAIYNAGNLTLESCIFSDNQATLAGAGYGGAVYTTGTNSALTVTGCTFYGNKATGTSSRGGAVYKASGALTLAGNIFWDNTAAAYPVLYTAGTTPVAKGFNVSDKPGGTGTEQSGWAFATGAAPDTQAPALPVHPSDFKPLSNGAAYQSISAKPEGYPGFDFYGVSIPDINAMVGAVQTAIITSGYMLDSAPQGGGVVNVSSGTPDGYGFYSGSVTLTATDGLGVFQYWTVNGERQPDQSPPTELTLAMDGPKTVRAVFVTAWTVNSAGNDGAGSLRDALERAQDGDTIVLAGQTITLETPLDPINKSLTILGNGATLTQSGFTASTASQLLYIGSATAEVSINRLHFKGGRVTNQGGAIYNAGNLTLESCIFSDNQATLVGGYGGAVYTTGTGSALTVTGCTFYGNKATGTSSWGGAVYKASGTLTLAGNIFWGNTAATYPVLYTAGTTPVTKGFNVSDQPGGTGTVQSGWTFAGTDTQGSGLPVYPSNFKPLSSGAAYQRISSKPDGYPAFDFYGDPIPASNAMAGAVQAAIVTLGYMLDYAAQGGGTVSVTSGTPDGYGFYSGSVTLTATDGDGGTFQYWTLNGERQPDQTTPNVLSLSMDGHKTVRAVFATTWTVTSTADSGVGTLRQAINDAAVGESIILPAGQTITLTAMLTVNKSLVIEGNGATLTQSGLTTGAINQLLSITGATTTVRISRLHFTGGRSKDYGSAIRNAGILTLESCIFSDNVTDYGSSYSFGGAIATTAGSLTVLGCTFTENSSLPGNSQGAAIFRNGGTLSLTGNIFAGNIAGSAESTTSYPVVYGGNSNTTTGGYNVSDKATGTSSGTSGWTFNTDPADVTLTDVTFDTDFKPSSTSNGLPVIPDLPAGFPATYFNGADRGSNSTPGAMPKN